MTKDKLAIVAVSGGMDSCVTAAIASQSYNLAFVHINYGQRTQKRELKAFNDIANFYNVEKRLIIDLSYFSKIGGSSLTDSNMEVTKADLENKNELLKIFYTFHSPEYRKGRQEQECKI